MASDINSESSGSDSGSTPEEEMIRRLFQTCDGNGDGYIDSQDLLAVCQQLNLEHCVGELMEQLGADEEGRISYAEFLRRRMQLMNEINTLTHQDQETPSIAEPTSLRQPSGEPQWKEENDTILGAVSEKHDSWEFDSGTRDLSPEPNTLQKLIEASGGSIPGDSGDLLELANKLHLAAVSSLKCEVYELTSQLQRTSRERDFFERQLHTDRLHRSRERECRLKDQAQRYEERITELHSVIAELSKKLEIQRATVIKEEDEYSQQSGDDSRISDILSQCTSNENLASDSVSDKEISRHLHEEEPNTEVRQDEHQEGEDTSSGLGENESVDEKANKGVQEGRHRKYNTENRATSCHSLQMSQYHEEVLSLRTENLALHDQLSRQETELNRTKAALSGIREDRDRLQRRVREVQSKLQLQSAQGSQAGSSPTVPHWSSTTTGELSPSNETPVAKIAERVRLRKLEGSDCQILGSEMTSLGISSSKVAEQLVQPLQEESQTQEIFQSLRSVGSPVPESHLREFEVETERLSSKIEHLRSQNDLLNLALEESRGQCDRLSVLLGKHESNNTALQLALAYGDRALEAFDTLLNVVETEQALVLANCRAAGFVGTPVEESCEKEQEVTCLLQRVQDNRRVAESMAKQFLHKLDRQYGVVTPSSCALSPWEDVSSHSHTTSTTSSTSSSCDGELTKADEQRLRDYIGQLRNERTAVQSTVLELESVHIDARGAPSLLDAHKLDLENAVLMQELTAIKEEKAELKAQVYLLEKEKVALEFQSSSWEAREQACTVTINHLKTEQRELQQIVDRLQGRTAKVEGLSPDVQELAESQKREKKLKGRMEELLATLEKVTKNSELRAQQSSEFVNDLKRANSALVGVFEKAKKKNQTKVKRLEQQLTTMTDRHNAQVRMLKQRIAMLESSGTHHTLPLSGSETSL
ncbi:colorectal mutant cancer protein-like [Ornithodoros turicata]|uniref:colorectal mutant cancer protein-like n=1 Tax=Ornithodoros turicata TaxID=34597 RepID=UPI00313A2417